MFKQTNLIKGSKGFTLVEAIVTIGLLSGAAYLAITLSRQSTKTLKGNIDRNQVLLISEQIVSEIAYSDTCLGTTTLSNDDLITMLNNKSGNFTVTAPDGSIIASNEENVFFKTKIQKLSVEDVELAKTSYGYKFYSGELYLEIGPNNKIQRTRLGSINFLVNDTSFVIACARQSDLHENSDYISAKNNSP